MPIDRASCSPAPAGVMMGPARNHASTVHARQRVRCLSRKTFIKRIQLTRTLETPPPESYYPAAARSDTRHSKLRIRGNEARGWLFQARGPKGSFSILRAVAASCSNPELPQRIEA